MARSRLATLLSLAIVVAGCAAAATPSGAPSPVAPEATTAVESPIAAPTTAPPSVAATPEPSAPPPPAQPDFPLGDSRDAILEVAVDGGVRVRSYPSVDDTSEKYNPLLRRGDQVFVIGGPVAGDGYDWYLVQSLIDGERGPLGWVSFASRDGEPWIQDVEKTDCPSMPEDAQRLGVILDEVLITCLGDRDIKFEMEAGISCFPDDPPFIQHDWLGLECSMQWGDACGTCGLRVATDPAAGIELPQRDHARWAVRGHFDDPASADCAIARGVEPARPDQAAVHACRSTFVLTSLKRLGDAAS